MTVKVERRPDADAVAGEAAGQDLNTIGVSVRVDVIEPDGVERSMGKMRRIVDQRGGQ